MSHRFLVCSNAADAAGRSALDFLLPLLAVAMLGAQASDLGILNAIQTAGFLLLGVPLGALVDRMSSAAALAAFLGVKIVSAGLLLAGLLTGGVSMAGVYAVAALLGVGSVGAEAAQAVATARVSASGATARLYARLQSADTAASIALPALAALVYGASPVFVVAASLALFGAAALAGSRIRGAAPEPEGSEHRSGMWSGFRVIATNRVLLVLHVVVILTNVALAIASTVEPVLVLSTLEFSERTYGLLVSAGAGGALLGSLVAPAMTSRFPLGRIVSAGYAGLALAACLLPLATYVGQGLALVIVAVQAVAWGWIMVVANVAAAAWATSIIPPSILGRATGAGRTLTMGVVPVASILGGIAADRAGIVPTLWLSAALVAAAAALALGLLGRARR